MGKFDIEPCRGVTNPDQKSHIRVRAKVRKNNRDKIENKQKKENDKNEFGSDLAVFN
jgi:hypothetical protein